MISETIKKRIDPEVYEFYRAALEGPGFSANFTAADIPALRLDEIDRHSANLNLYVTETLDLTIDRKDAEPLPIRLYFPNEDATSANNPDAKPSGSQDRKISGNDIFTPGRNGANLPVILYFHGGGFVMGSIYDHDPLCGKIADACGAIVISVEYRLAPEYPFPYCIDDAVDAANWAYEHISDFGGDPDILMAGGDSSGANISAALALIGRDYKRSGGIKSPEIKCLILFYGVYGCYDLENSRSANEFGRGDYVLPNDMMMSCMDMYLPKEKFPDGIYTKDQRLAPGRDADLSDFPPSIIVSAEFDPLRDDSEEFAKRLDSKGVDVKLIRMDGMMHGFILYWQHFKRAEKLISDIGGMIRSFVISQC